jgi:hypothetical protein
LPRDLRHDRQGAAFGILEERHPFLDTIGVAMDEVRRIAAPRQRPLRAGENAFRLDIV